VDAPAQDRLRDMILDAYREHEAQLAASPDPSRGGTPCLARGIPLLHHLLGR
jgi:hypothetical protein